jgi:hypothetical protein
MNPCEEILEGMKPVIRAYHTDRWLPEAPPLPEEDLYRLRIPACIALVASLVIAFFVLSGWNRVRSAHSEVATCTSE